MKNKLKILAALLCVIPFYVIAQQKLVIKGIAPLLKDGTEISIETILPKRMSESKKFFTRLNKHSFEFDLNVREAEIYRLKVNDDYSSPMFLAPNYTNLVITDNKLKNIQIENNVAYSDYEKYISDTSSWSASRRYTRARIQLATYQNSKGATKETFEQKSREIEELKQIWEKSKAALCRNWINTHPGSYINTYILYDQLFYMPDDEVKAMFSQIPADKRKNTWGRELKYVVDNLIVGAQAPDFNQSDTNGYSVSLKKFRGKYVLIDFWASWCIPCRNENPGMVNIMEKYSGHNFTILGISLDDTKADWLVAIRKDRLNWTQLSDLKGWKNAAALNYYAFSIPANYLIDPNGKIIARNLHGDDLDAFLGKLKM